MQPYNCSATQRSHVLILISANTDADDGEYHSFTAESSTIQDYAFP